MGSKYGSGTSVSGYNASPPSDGGAATEENRITWAKIKSKLPDPLKTAIEAINTALVDAFDFGPVSKSSTYTTVAGDHVKTITCTSAITVNLLDASTGGAGYTVNISNQSTGNVTIGRATSGDTINGSAADMTLARGNAVTLRVNTAANGYEVIDTGLKDVAGLAKTDGNFIVGDGTSWVAESGSTARESLGLGTAATQNTGTSGTNVPLLDGANTWSAGQTYQSTDAGAGAGPTFDLDRASASPAVNDLLGFLRFRGRSSAGTNREYAGVLAVLKDPTDAAEDAELFLRTTIAGSGADRVRIGSGFYTSGATGGDQGADTINAAAYYENGTRMDAQGVAKAWVLFQGTGTTTVLDSFNVSSVTDHDTGYWTVNFASALPNATYTVAGHGRALGNPDTIVGGNSADTRTVSAYSVRVKDADDLLFDAEEVNVIFFGA